MKEDIKTLLYTQFFCSHLKIDTPTCSCEKLIFRSIFWCNFCKNNFEKRGKIVIFNQINYLCSIKSSNQLPIIYDVGYLYQSKPSKNQCGIEFKGGEMFGNLNLFSDNSLNCIESATVITIPNKVLSDLRLIPRGLKRKISQDLKVADELCIIFLSLLNPTSFRNSGFSIERDWRNLSVKILRKIFSSSPHMYKSILNVLQFPLKKGVMIEKNNYYRPLIESYKYRLSDRFVNVGMQKYNLKTKKAIILYSKYQKNKWIKVTENCISKNLLSFYHKVSLPLEYEIYQKGKLLERENYLTKKGKKLIALNKRNPDQFPKDQYSYVETAIKIYNYLFFNKIFRIPMVGNSKSGGRIIDSIVLVPSWIRSLFKINGKESVEVDYVCLHPNIAMKIYGGQQQYLTHQKISDELGLDLRVVKTEHLSFFNKTIWQMEKSPLFEYYNKNEPQMLQRIIKEKQESEFKHKITSRRLFGFEVEIMSSVISHLNSEGIFVGYIYDAIMCEISVAEKVKSIMNLILDEKGVYTIAK